MRKLAGKTFSKKYNFKRLLQTTPDLSKLYSKHEVAVNSVRPIRQIPIFENGPSAVYHPGAKPRDVCEMEIFGPGEDEWPSRVKYAEQILDVRAEDETAWVVQISRQIRDNPKADIIVDVLEYRKPAITVHYPVFRDQPNNHCPIFSENKLSKIDQHERVSYFLVSQSIDMKPANLIECGLIPNGLEIYNTTFHHKDIALLYADSLREIVSHFPGYSI